MTFMKYSYWKISLSLSLSLQHAHVCPRPFVYSGFRTNQPIAYGYPTEPTHSTTLLTSPLEYNVSKRPDTVYGYATLHKDVL